MASLVDTNILVYRCDPHDPVKRAAASEVLRQGVESGDLRISHQSLVEFMNVVLKPRRGFHLMSREDATRQVEQFMVQLPVLYPDEHVFRIALWGMAAYQLPWFDAHLWAYAEHYNLAEIISEDFQHGRRYGSVTIKNPFVALGLA